MHNAQCIMHNCDCVLAIRTQPHCFDSVLLDKFPLLMKRTRNDFVSNFLLVSPKGCGNICKKGSALL